ncbi:GH25 family lysozyme [Salipiger mangrovisoli]|uniref:Glycoside hydrolase family 25 protein n=1 Tax=Salipiger mangrovisoli TaxID=2865933 RepID=A0ABR9WZT3_9RHOB|nr:GH25 family lysozyme [Salipiger mangrovisoli]MBE9636768.1 glycoside hydrolase family 25 protein [Salipiger mangrovisoli]
MITTSPRPWVRAGALIVALAATLGGCGSSAPRTATLSPSETQALYVRENRASGIPRRFGDSKPHDWGTIGPATYPVHGLDAARYQGVIDWHTARGAGIRFGYLKATEGGDVLDPAFAQNAAGARAAGVPVGAYHFYYFCRPASEQAAWFIANVPKRRGDLPPILDMEWNHLSPTCRIRPPAEEVRASIREFSRIVERHYGTAPVIYTTPDFYARNDLGSLRGTEFWLRSVTAHPAERYPDERWSFWQYTGTGLVPGVRGSVDLNAFAGNEANWQAWLAARSQG